MDWSDHAIWWPSQNKWLDKTRWTLDQYNVNADTVIHFTPMHKTLRYVVYHFIAYSYRFVGERYRFLPKVMRKSCGSGKNFMEEYEQFTQYT